MESIPAPSDIPSVAPLASASDAASLPTSIAKSGNTQAWPLFADLRDALSPYVSVTTQVLAELAFSALATVVLLLVLRILRKLDDLGENAVRRLWTRDKPPLRIQGLELMSREQLGKVMLRSLRATKLVLGAICVVIYINFILGFFPRTAKVSRAFFSQLADSISNVAYAVVDYLPNLASILVIGAVVYGILAVSRRIFTALDKGLLRIDGFYPDWAIPTYQLVRVLVLALAAIAMFPYLPGAGSPAFQGVSIFLGVLISLGSTSAVAHVVAGVVLVYMRPFAVGDRVRIADTLGDVIDKNLLSVRLRTPRNVELVIPNASVLAARIENISTAARASKLMLCATATIGYDVDWRQVHELMLSAAKKTRDIVDTPKPFVRQTALGDFSIAYEVNCFTGNAKDMLDIESELRAAVLDAFQEANVEILSPQYTSLRDGSRSTTFRAS